MTNQTDAEFIAELRALAEKATGLTDIPWEARNGDVYFDGERVAQNCWSGDADFIAASRTAIPRLLDMVEGLTRERNDARAGRRLVSKGAMDLGAEHCFVVAERDAALAEVARLREALALIEIKQPDGDGLVWASFATPQRQFGSFNLGTADRFATKVALEFERLRRAALAPKE